MPRRCARPAARDGRASSRPAFLLSVRALLSPVARRGILADSRCGRSFPLAAVRSRLARLALAGWLLCLGSRPDADGVRALGPLKVERSLSLTADIRVPADGIGLAITGSYLSVDLNGHEIVGDGTGTGISIEGQSEVVVMNGRIRGCAQGVLLKGSGKHQLKGLLVQGNESDGIQILGSDGNGVTDCTVLENGRTGLLLQDAHSNRITGNRFLRNRGPGDSGGITVEYSSNNEISNNTFQENGAWGMRLLERSERNLLAGNRITDTNVPATADPAHPDQPAILWQPGLVLNAGASRNELRANVLTGNGVGLFLWSGAVGNLISGNQASGDHSLDLVDLNATCAANTWTDNQFGRASRVCDH